MSSFKPPIWLKPSGQPVSCVEKVKVLNENFAELHELAQEALDDAILMGGTQVQVKQALRDLVDSLMANYPEQQE